MLDWKQFLSFAVVLFAASFFVRSFQPAHALNGPSTDLGANPHQSFYGDADTTITLESTQDFIIQTAMGSNDYCRLLIDGVIINKYSASYNPLWYNGAYPTNSVFVSGRAHLRVPAGAILRMEGCSGWYVDGYYTRP
jgi:hypothetical protein